LNNRNNKKNIEKTGASVLSFMMGCH